ncbi:hypothetical protein GCM10007938_29890 [Vibrio zhanjiangensis]|uniref:Uncharacterized protein n=1 Tax=Vibrio zhanjiangensis TaxID=1046128 RepID=A0ABQ6F133_9VIBR|nr:hypothetical protein [Vibrio zhanjiangensis]GLT19207.1 hypothetical protein GCM10007938_29890 [Vibrio zhanjiangensis]
MGFLQYYQELEEGLPDEFYIAHIMVDVKYQGHAMRRFYSRFEFVVTEEDEQYGVVMELKVK